MNDSVFFVRVFGMLIPLRDVMLVQVNPNNPKQVVQEIPLTRPLEDLMEYNCNSFVKIHNDRHEWVKEMDGKDIGRQSE